MSKQIQAVKVAEIECTASTHLRNGNSGGFTVALKTEILPGKCYWTNIPSTFLTQAAAEKHARKLAKKFNCEVQK